MPRMKANKIFRIEILMHVMFKFDLEDYERFKTQQQLRRNINFKKPYKFVLTKVILYYWIRIHIMLINITRYFLNL